MQLTSVVLLALKRGAHGLFEAVLKHVINSIVGYLLSTVTVLLAVIQRVPGLKNSSGAILPLSGAAWTVIGLTISLAVVLWLLAKHRQSGRREEFRTNWLAAQMMSKRRRGSPLVPPVPPASKNIFIESISDAKYRIRALGLVAAYVVLIASLALSLQKMFAAEVTVWPRADMPLQDTIVVIRSGNETITTGTLDSEGIRLFKPLFVEGEYEIIVCKLDAGNVYWSKKVTKINRDQPEIEVTGFPQYSHRQIEIPPVLFGLDSSTIKKSNAKAILEIQQLLINQTGDILVAGRADGLDFKPGSERSNYQLSLDRCKAVISKLDLVTPPSHLILAPLDNQLLLAPDATTDVERMPDRSVNLIRLMPVNELLPQ